MRDLTGQQFGRLKVLEESGRSSSGNVLWLCLCECGNKTLSNGSILVKGDKKSCGCLRKEVSKAKGIKRRLKFLNQPSTKLEDGSGNPDYWKFRAKTNKKRRQERRDGGLCPWCGGERDSNKFLRCALCREKNKNHRNDYQRRRVTVTTGKRLIGDKRVYPEDKRCELCSEEKHLCYHHWDDDNLKKGVWVCVRCHVICEYMDNKNEVFNKYTILKSQIEKNHD